MTQAKTSTQVLKAMYWILDNVGWCQGLRYADNKGQSITRADIMTGRVKPAACCLIGARYLVVSTYEADNKAWARLKKRHGDYSLVPFNDRPGRTKQEVLKLIQDEINSPSL